MKQKGRVKARPFCLAGHNGILREDLYGKKYLKTVK
jgi:hypothetical protein